MGRKKSEHPKTRNTYSLQYVGKLKELKERLAPKGLHITDGQAIDVLVATMHEIMFDERLLGVRLALLKRNSEAGPAK